MLIKTTVHRLRGALGAGALMGLLALVAGCSSTPAAQPTAVATSAVSVPTQAATASLPPPEPKATNTISALPSPTLPLATAITALPTPSLPAVDTPVPTPEVKNTAAPIGDLGWKQVGLAGNNVTDISFLSQGNNVTVLAAGLKGVWTGTYDYSQWDAHTVAMAEEAHGAEAYVASSDVLYVISGTGCPSGLPNARSRSTDGGKTWQEMPGEAITIAVSNPAIAYGAKCGGIIKTTDSGATWTDLTTPIQSSDPISLAASPDGDTVYVAYVSEGGTGQIIWSKDGGATWTEVTPRNLPAEGFVAPNHLTFVTGSEGRPNDAGLYLTNNDGVWFLPIGGSSWKLMKRPPLPTDPAGGFSNYTALFVDTAFSADYDKPGPIIYAARAYSTESSLIGQGVQRSSDMGATWESVGKGLEQHVVNSLALISYDGPSGRVETLLAATDDGIWALTMPANR